MKKDLRPTVRRRNTLVTQFFVLVMLLSSLGVWGQVSITTLPYSKSDNFDAYNPTNPANALTTLPAGWSINGATNYQGRGNGSSNSGGFWAYGATTTENSLGALTSGGNLYTYTVSFTNNSGSTITSITLAWDYEQWRFANTSGINVTGTGQLAANATLNAKDFVGTSTGTNGTVAVTPVSSFNLTGLSITNGQSFGVTWVTTDAASSDNGVAIDNFSIVASGAPSVPSITVSPAVTGLDYIVGSGPSAPKTFTVSGSNLTADIAVTAPANFEISTASAGTYGNSLSLTQTAGSVATTTLYARLAAGLPVNSYSGNITTSSTGATDKTIAVSGAVSRATITSAQTGPWSQTSTWVGGVVPSSANNAIIANGHTVTMDSNMFSTRDLGTTTTVNTGGTLATNVQYINNGSTTINGAFQLNAGGYTNSGNDFVYGATGTLIFNNTSSYGVNNTDQYWPTINGPFNVNILQGGMTLNTGADRTVAGTFTVAGTSASNTAGVLFPNATLTLNGIAQINTYGYFGNSPIYGNASTLIYNTSTANGAYGRASEWNQATGTIGSTPGYPNNVQLSNTSTLDYPNTGGSPFSMPLGIAGSLTIDAGSALYMDFNGGGIRSGRLTVGKNVNLSGNISLGDAIGGDLYVGGNWTKAITSTFNPNNRAVFFNGTAGQTITGDTNFAYLTINNAAGVTLANNIVTNFVLDFNLGKITLGANNLTIANGGSIVNADTAKYIVTNGAGQLRRTVGNTATLFAVGNTAYNPITFTNSGTSDIYGVRVTNTAPAGADPSKTVTRQWITSEAVAGGSNLSVVAQYNSGETGANYNAGTNPFIGYYDGTAFTQVAATLSGANPITATSAANLSPVSLTAGTGYFAVGKDNGLISVPAKYVISNITPTSPLAGSGFSATVTVQDAYNQSSLVSSASTFTLTSNGNAGAISGTTTGTIAAGSNSVVVTGIILPNAGTGVTITATNTSGFPLTAGTSAPFIVLGLATKLMFSGVPANGTAGSNLASFTVRALRADDTLDTNYTGTVTIAKASGSGTISGTLTRTAAAGVATFNDIQFDAADTYTITATVTGLTSATSGNIVIAPNPATGYFRSNAASGNWNAPATWQSSADGMTGWATATVSPTSAANTITIRNGNNISVVTSITLDQLVIENEGQLTVASNSGTLNINDGIGVDIDVQTGGVLQVTGTADYQATIIFASSSSMNVNGKILVGDGVAANGSNYDRFATTAIQVIWNDGAIFEWNSVGIFSATNRIFFPDVSPSTVPIFRFSKGNGSAGGGTATVINGLYEINGVTSNWTGNSTKIFRNGITSIGNGAIVFTSNNNGIFQIGDGTNGDGIFGSDTGVLTVENKNGITLSSNFTATLTSNINLNISSTNFTNNGILIFGNNVMNGNGGFRQSGGATIITSNTGGVPGSVAVTGTKTFSADLANYTFNAATTTPFIRGITPTPSARFGTVNINADVTNNVSGVTTFFTKELNINAGTFSMNSAAGSDLSLSNTDGVVNIAAGATFDNGGENQITSSGGIPAINVLGTFVTRDTQGFTGTNAAIPGITPTLGANSTIVFGKLGDQFVTDFAYQNITFAGSGTKTSVTINSIAGTATINSGVILDADSKTFGGSGTNLTMLSNALFKTGGGGTKPDAGGVYTLDPASTIEFQGTSATDIRVSRDYENIVVSGTKVKPSAKNLKVNQITTVTATGSLTLPSTVDNASPTVITSKRGVNVNSGGTFILENNAQLMQDADAVNTGDITAQRITTVPNSTFNQYVYFSSPVIDQNYKNIFGGNTSALRYVESTDKFVFSNGFITSGGALAVRNPTKTFGNITAEFKGTPFVGDFDYGPLDFTDLSHGYNLVGNPYPSNLDLNKVYVNSTNLDSTFLFWDNYANTISDQQGSNYHGYAYATFNALSNTGVKATGSAGNTNGDPTSSAGLKLPNNILKVGQGMLVKTLSGGASVGFKNADRITAQSGAEFFGKSAVDSTSNRYWLEMLTPANLLASNAIVYFENGTNEFSKDDSKMESSVSDALFTNAGEEKVVINGRSTFADTDVLHVGNRFFVNGTYQIRLGKKEGIFASGQKIYLKDRMAGVIADLEQGSYSFSANAGEQTGRFEIIYKPESVLATTGATTDQLQVYRNGEVFTVKSSDGKIGNVEVYDLSGRLLQIALGKGTEVNIDAAGLSNGLYILKIKRNNSTISKKIIK